MPCFARPAVWSYDLPLFRLAISSEEELEAMLAGIAAPEEGLWVVEERERPVAFAWTKCHSRPPGDDPVADQRPPQGATVRPRIDGGRLDFVRVFVAPKTDPAPAVHVLLARIAAEPACGLSWHWASAQIGGVAIAMLDNACRHLGQDVVSACRTDV